MTRRVWLVVLGAGVCGSLLPACTRAVVDRGPTGFVQAPPPPQIDRSTVAAYPHSPYAAAEVSLVRPDVRPAALEQRRPEPSPAVAREQVSQPAVATLGAPAALTVDAEPAPNIKRTSNSAVGVPAAAPEPPLLAAMRCFLAKRPTDAMARLQDYDRVNQELLLGLLPLAALLTEGSLARTDPRTISAVVDQLDNLSCQLRPQAALTVDRICFCRWIETFGRYEPMPDDYEFLPGDKVRVYVELRNVASVKRNRGPSQLTYIIRLASSAEIRDFGGNKVWPPDSGRIVFERERPVDESRTLRHDYFEKYQFFIPDELQPGRYTLVIEVEDLGTHPPRKVHRSLDFRVTNLRAGSS
jgi:hypothetical protein